MNISRYKTGLQTIVLILATAVTIACDVEPPASAPGPEQEATPVWKESQQLRQAALPPAKEAPEASPAEDEQVLDLNVSVDSMSADDDLDYPPTVYEGRLPNLFDGPEKQRKTQINTELLRDENNPDIVDSVEGVNVAIERKLGD